MYPDTNSENAYFQRSEKVQMGPPCVLYNNYLNNFQMKSLINDLYAALRACFIGFFHRNPNYARAEEDVRGPLPFFPNNVNKHAANPINWANKTRFLPDRSRLVKI